jgi:hypothetical protein
MITGFDPVIFFLVATKKDRRVKPGDAQSWDVLARALSRSP